MSPTKTYTANDLQNTYEQCGGCMHGCLIYQQRKWQDGGETFVELRCPQHNEVITVKVDDSAIRKLNMDKQDGFEQLKAALQSLENELEENRKNSQIRFIEYLKKTGRL